MSATNRSNKRVPGDFYPTPEFAVHRLLDQVDLPYGLWFEPCAGTGAIIDHVASWHAKKGQQGPNWMANELSFWAYPHLSLRVPDATYGDFLNVKWEYNYDVIITNPPFFIALDIIQHSLSMKPRYVVMLLRTNFLESEKRAKFFRSNMPDVYVLPNRPSCSGDGKTDATSYSWMIWTDVPKEEGSIRLLGSTPKAER